MNRTPIQLEHNPPLPPGELRFMAESDAAFLRIGNDCLAELQAEGLADTGDLLDVGSGYGRLAHALLRSPSFRGSYEGFDVLARHVAWCQQNLAPHAPRFCFRHIDVFHERYNRGGVLAPGSFPFPYASRSFDVVSLFSIFTHFFESDIQHYLGEIARLLRPGGFCHATFFLSTPYRHQRIVSTECPLRMAQPLNDHTWYHNPNDKLHAICHDLAHVERWIAAAGLTIGQVRFGNWTGEPGQGYQDTIVMKAP